MITVRGRLAIASNGLTRRSLLWRAILTVLMDGIVTEIGEIPNGSMISVDPKALPPPTSGRPTSPDNREIERLRRPRSWSSRLRRGSYLSPHATQELKKRPHYLGGQAEGSNRLHVMSVGRPSRLILKLRATLDRRIAPVFASMALNRQMLVTAARNGRPLFFWERPSRALPDPEVALWRLNAPSAESWCARSIRRWGGNTRA
jgi:hypothetical protein